MSEAKSGKDKSGREAFPVLPLRDIVVFPYMIVPLFVGREKSIAALEEVMRSDKQILLAAQKNAGDDDPASDAIYQMGTLASVLQLLKLPDGTVKVLVEGTARAKIVRYIDNADYFEAEVERVPEGMGAKDEIEALARSAVSQFESYVKLNKKISPEVLGTITQIEDYSKLADTIASHLAVKISDKPAADKVGIHGKYLTISGGFDGTARELVWMGSENLTRNALVQNDETFLLIDQPQLLGSFTENFQRIWDTASLTAGCGRAGGVSEEEIEQEADEEITPLIKEQQQVKRKLPKRLKKRTELKSTRTVQGQRLTTVVKCRVKGTPQKLKKRKICALKKPKSNPTVVLTPKRKKRLSVRIVQTAPGSATLQKFSRKATYTYRR